MSNLRNRRKMLLIWIAVFGFLKASFASADCPASIAGATYVMNTNNTNEGMFSIASNCLSGQFDFSGGTYSVTRMKISSPNRYGTREIVFMRNDAYRQYYNGWISGDGNVISGYLINVNNNIPSIEKFPFFAKKP